MTRLHFALLILTHLIQSLFIRDGIVLDGDLRGHAAHGVNAAAVAGLNQQLHIQSSGNAASW